MFSPLCFDKILTAIANQTAWVGSAIVSERSDKIVILDLLVNKKLFSKGRDAGDRLVHDASSERAYAIHQEIERFGVREERPQNPS